MKRVVDVFFPPLPTTLAPTDYVRRWDHAGLMALVVFTMCVLACALAWSKPLGLGMRYVLWGILTWDDYFAAQATALHYVAVASSWLVAGTLAALTFKGCLRPYNHERQISGMKVHWELEDSAKQAQIQSKALCGGQDPWLYLHPFFPIPKTWATRGCLIVGSVGAGKTETLKYHIQQHLARNRRMVIYDVKGDFTQMYLHGKHACLLSPWDERSKQWDIARDINSKARAAAFARGFFPDNPDAKDKIWADGSWMVLTAILVEIMREHGEHWGWDTINRWICMSHAELTERLKKDHPMAVKAMAKEGSNTASSMEMTLGIGVQFISDLAQAWPYSEKAERVSLFEWMTNGRTQLRQIIVKAGPDKASTSSLMGGIFNYLANAVTDASILPDDELARSLVFIVDEFPTINRFDIDRLILVGRSKGIVTTLGLQDIAQVDKTYGKEWRLTIESSIATKIYCQIGQGETRKAVAESFGYKQIANLLPQYTFGTGTKSQTISVKSEPRAVLDATDLTDKLGPRRGKHYKNGYAIRALLTCGGDPLLMEWEGLNVPKVSPAHVSASWTKRPQKHKTFRQLYGVMGTDFVRERQALRRVIEMFEQHHAQRRQAPKALDQWKAKLGAERA